MSGFNSFATLLTDATRRLSAVLALEPREARIEARVLLAHALNVDHAWLIAHDRDAPCAMQLQAIEDLIARRAAGEPVAYILGEREFFGRTFNVTPDVLIPRPETELLVEAALLGLPSEQPIHVLDIGVGSGVVAITLALERPCWRVHGIDISPGALNCAKHNADRLNAEVAFSHGDIFPSLVDQRFDLIVSNPPYIAAGDTHLQRGDLRFEPQLALASGIDGLAMIRRLIAGAPSHLKPGGSLWLEHGWDQGHDIRSQLLQTGFEAVQTRTDLAGLPRISGGRTS